MRPRISCERLKERFPAIKGPKTQDICYATENRQLGVKAVVPLTDVLLVVGSQNSSNSRRLVEVCQNEGVPAYLVDDSTEVNPAWLDGTQTVAVTAGASAPENLVQELIQSLETKFGFDYMEEMELKEEDVRFHLPADLERSALKLTTHRSRMSPKLPSCRHFGGRALRKPRGALPSISPASSLSKATGGRSLPPTPRSNPITFCCNFGCIRR